MGSTLRTSLERTFSHGKLTRGDSERQYKRKITEWHLDKNVKDSEVRYIIQVQSSRARLGKETTFRVRGRAVPSSKIERFRQRKGLRTNADMLPDYQTPSRL